MILAPGLVDVNLQPGELYLSRGPAMLRTILGSCVGVTFWSARCKAGALCHGVLPRTPQLWTTCNVREGGRFVDFSIRYLAQCFDVLGITRRELVVKVFGGADVLPIPRPGKPTIGVMNCQVAAEVLLEEGFLVAASDTGGIRGRRIHFDTGTGEILLHRLAAWRGFPETGKP